ncbi:MAG: F0F1 ATP synthase subunit B [Anaerolineales bacterium]
MEALGLNLGFLLVQIFNFLIIFIILRAFVFSPIIDLLNKRRTSIAQGLQDAQVAAEAKENAEKDAQEIIAAAQAEANQKVQEATERAEKASKEIIAQAEIDAAKEHEAAIADAQLERERILADIRRQVGGLAIAAAQKLVGEALDEKRQHALLDEFFSGVKSGKIVVLEDASLSGASAEITSALPLTDQEKETVRNEIISKTGSQTVTFRVDPSILGGLLIKVGDKVLDGSVAGQLQTLQQTLS